MRKFILLHEHLDGHISPNTLSELSSVHFDISDYLKDKNLLTYLELFKLTTSCMKNKDNLERITKECLDNLLSQNVIYTELRFAPQLCVTDSFKLEEVIETVLEVMSKHQLKSGLILCGLKNEDITVTSNVFNQAIRYKNKGIVGVDLSGPEIGYDLYKYRNIIEKVKSENVGVTIHAGEVGAMEYIEQAVKIGADRIGHGIRIIDSLSYDGSLSDLAWHIIENNITLEVCPTSNYQTGAVKDNHPIMLLDSLGFPVTFNTDNQLITGHSMNREWEMLSQHFNLTEEHYKRWTTNAISGIFNTEQLKLQLSQEMNLIHGTVYEPAYS